MLLDSHTNYKHTWCLHCMYWICFVRLLCSVNCWSHWLQAYNTPSCDDWIWCFTPLWSEYCLSHWLQENLKPSCAFLICLFRWLLWVYCLSHWLQEYLELLITLFIWLISASSVDIFLISIIYVSVEKVNKIYVSHQSIVTKFKIDILLLKIIRQMLKSLDQHFLCCTL